MKYIWQSWISKTTISFLGQTKNAQIFPIFENHFRIVFSGILRILRMSAKYLRRFSAEVCVVQDTSAGYEIRSQIKLRNRSRIIGRMAEFADCEDNKDRISKEMVMATNVRTANWDIAVAGQIMNLVRDNGIRVRLCRRFLDFSRASQNFNFVWNWKLPSIRWMSQRGWT